LAALHAFGLVAPQRRGARVLAGGVGLRLDLVVARTDARGLPRVREAGEQHVAVGLRQRPVLLGRGRLETVGVFPGRLLVGGGLGGGARGVGGPAVAAAGDGAGRRGEHDGAEDGAVVHAWAPCSAGSAASRPSIASATSSGCSITVMWPLPSSSTLRACGIFSA